MTSLELWIKRHHRRLAFGQFLQRAGEGLAVFLFLFGAVVLTAKLFLPHWWPHVLWLGTLAIPLLLAAWWQARQMPFSRQEAVALLDRQLKGGGLIMALSEADDPAWHDRLPQTPELWKRKLPKIRPLRFVRLVGWPMVFALGALLIPLRDPTPAMGFSPAAGQQATRQLEGMLGLLEEAHVLAPEESQQLKTVIHQLKQDTRHTPLTHEKWETIDRLREELTHELMSNERAVALAREAAAKLLNAAALPNGELPTEHRAQLEKNVLDLLGSLANRQDSSPDFSPELQQLLQQGRKQLAEDPELQRRLLRQMQGLFNERAGDLQQVRSRFDQAFAQMPSRLPSQPAPAPSSNSPSPGDTKVAGPGNGTEQPWGEEADEKRAKFKQVVLPPGFLDQATNDVAGVTAGNPTPNEPPSDNVAPARPRSFDPASGREVRSRELRPRHRDVVKKYFTRPAPSPDASNQSED